jgi:hypothetical protein
MPPTLPSITFESPRQGSTSQFSVFDQVNSNSHPNSFPTMSRQPHQQDPMLSMNGYTTQLPQAANGAMAPPEKPREAHKLDISTLMSPPDTVLDNFSNSVDQVNYTTLKPLADNGADAGSKRDETQPLMSPPISPYNEAIVPADQHQSTSLTPTRHAVNDPVLYPQEDNSSASTQTQAPLFASTDLEHHHIVDQHIRNRSPDVFSSGVTPPEREHYDLVLNFRSQVMKLFNADRKAWLRREKGFLKSADAARRPKALQKILPAKPTTVKSANKGHRVDRVSKPNPPRVNRTLNGQNASGGATPSRRTSATPDASRRMPNREDKDFESLPDFSPDPYQTLPTKPNSLKVEWKGSPMDLSKDPQAGLLHPDELLLAGHLRLDIPTYLTSKRRMFIRRLQCIGHKDFRKTDAQQACKIDVNKASKLWTAFDRVGWLDPKHMEKHLHRLSETY